MAGLVPAIHVFASATKAVDGRHKAGHDGRVNINAAWYYTNGLRYFPRACE
jgi:hypothetical protein